MNLTIRFAEEKDLDGIVALLNASNLGPANPDELKHDTLIALIEDTLAGTMTAHVSPNNKAFIENFAVAQNLQGSAFHIAPILIVKMLEYLNNRGIIAVEFLVGGEKAHLMTQLYTQYGGKIKGRFTRILNDNIPYSLDLAYRTKEYLKGT